MRRQPSLRSQLNQIRLWVRQGRTDAWIAHTLDISIDDLTRFKREHQLEGEEMSNLRPADPLSVPPPDAADELPEDEDEDEEDEADEDEEAAAPRRREPRSRSRPSRRSRPPRESRESREDRGEREREPEPRDTRGAGGDVDGDEAPRRRRRGRRGGRRHRARRNALEATFDHGEEGYGLWLDPAVVDNPVYAEHWAGHRAVTVTLEADSITIRRAAAGQQPDGGARPTPEAEPEAEPGDDTDDLDY